ncbi:glycosyltransferase family 2 protein [Streptomyces sp. SID13031]|uniref:glycosyltransferase family 2 protein n=1 Tax=Streptomyces sp. SID13031 TaxID=2706046 RepID=UPI0013CA3B41|nr:glycosyltransferase family 2 protein [Streptomyces sp. SID13031]NEA36863.1 glycosyltransferase family 2 protein [Streptomyces sp. SID13031]
MHTTHAWVEQSSEVKRELAVVVPVYNEVGCIRQVLEEWIATLDTAGLTDEHMVHMIIIDDGSTDGTSQILAELATKDQRLKVVKQRCGGHGPSVIHGYQLALESQAEYIFQIDSDNEFEPSEFASLWELRDRAPFVLGCRVRRNSPLHRRFISRSLRLLQRVLFQVNIPDSNVPYRLMGRNYLNFALKHIPSNVFIPNVYMSIVAHALQVPVVYVPISHRQRTTGKVSIHGWRLLRVCAKNLAQLVAWRTTFDPMTYNFLAHGAYFSGATAASSGHLPRGDVAAERLKKIA